METILARTQLTPHTELLLEVADLTQLKVDVIVNAANSSLQHGGGIAALIEKKGGPIITQESDAWVSKHGLVSHTHPALTNAGNLHCKKVIHAVGPIWGNGNEDQKLADAITGSLTLADQHHFNTIAFPAISTGIFGFPKQRGGEVIFRAIQTYVLAHPHTSLQTIHQTVYDTPTQTAFQQAWHIVFGN
jgi:O-acetyl-ADP-ribose deacetylase (regulator of RNase III)